MILKYQPEFFSAKTKQNIVSAKEQIDQIYNRASNPQEFVDLIEKELDGFETDSVRSEHYSKLIVQKRNLFYLNFATLPGSNDDGMFLENKTH